MQPTIAYCRRSTERNDSNTTLESQAEACQTYAKLHGLGECTVIAENFSGTVRLGERDEGRALWSAIQSGQVKHLICLSIDRLSRAPVDEALTQIKEILRAGVRLHFVDAGEIESSDGIVTIITAYVASEERKKIIERMMRGKRTKAAAGQWVGSGPVPFGFVRVGRLDEARLEKNPDAITIINLLIELYTGDTRLSMIGLRDELFRRGIPSPGSGKPVWFTSTIKRVMSSPTLIGRFDYGDQVIELPELAIIDQRTYNAIQDRMQANGQKARRNRQHDYLLAHRLKCSCGRSMTAIPQKHGDKNYAYYTCTSVQQHRAERTCPVHRLPAERMDAAIWQWVLTRTSDEFLSAGIAELEEYEQAQAVDPKRLAAIDAETKRLQAHIDVLMRQFKESEKAAIVEARNKQINQDADRIEALTNERANLTVTLERAEARTVERADLAERIIGLRVNLDSATPAQQVQALDVIELRVKLLERTELSKCIRVLITSQIAPPDELTL